MKIRTICHWLLLFGTLCLLWSVSSRQLCAGQNYPSRVRVFGNSPAAATAPKRVDPAEAADIRQLMDIVGTKATLARMMNTMESDMRPLMLHALPPGAYRERLVELFMVQFNARLAPQYLMDLAVPVYAQYFSDAEIKALIKFYKTPLGQKWISVQPKVSAELLPKARAWGREVGHEAMIEVLREHPHLAQELRAAQQAARSHRGG